MHLEISFINFMLKRVAGVCHGQENQKARKTQTNYKQVNPKYFSFFLALSVVPAGQVAIVAYKDERLFKALAAAAEQRLRNFKSQDLANTAWSFATVGHKEEQLFTALAAAAERRMRDFNS